MTRPPSLETAALTIAGSDSCGGAGIQADLKTFAACGVFGASVVTAITAQNTEGVRAAELTEPNLVTAQLEMVLRDLPVAAVKTGMLGAPGSIDAIRRVLGAQERAIPLVMDPVMVATSGAALADSETIQSMQALLAAASLVTPNLDEACALTGREVRDAGDMAKAAEALLEQGCAAVLIKGGHLHGPEVTDLLVTRDARRAWRHPRQPGQYHGTGCTLSAAVTAGLALGMDMETSVEAAIAFVQAAMQRGRAARRGPLVLLGHNLPG
ncbi:MAG: bifunctional hydroxymethylpyrimidine kinase/phosphomethylpyrimidine kinase [Xanthomonadales bacterium]|nr:bifunctional hydroxymethylpyrimidine kinase/phosphomethylpyrimidine kinase [Xanthomonadales bacterium]NIN59381.1 bifunctional hydroxymethylpyrimidine kinase/phosphomethylpyrimidine kinase [Xanthomonadales bacterium]NIN74732.1 bifunctional hydroxymethylpyrimidine kinase/phosphomethylpyrimidine kinase [Xanthomonadales bacterium]NIO14868.1 bifunctional hydroxymethylpyrimidine kinase/phosphomethylpyrimidine kinase [Xanthomonadales bacterium]NIP11774.1 bifunctional hydroxymethylpyrimidine kinase/